MKLNSICFWMIFLISFFASCTLFGQQQKTFRQYEEALSRQLIAEATAKSNADHELAVIELTKLYSELINDSRTPLSPTLNRYRVKLRSRLMKVLRELEIRIAREVSHPTRSNSDRLQSALQRHLSAVNRQIGGAKHLLSPRAGASVSDYGPQLVALIQRTITPQFWDVNGGQGVIVYYAPLRLLVVRATSQVHGQIRDLNGMLR
mgnify:CR=1 FL=1